MGLFAGRLDGGTTTRLWKYGAIVGLWEHWDTWDYGAMGPLWGCGTTIRCASMTHACDYGAVVIVRLRGRGASMSPFCDWAIGPLRD